MNLTELLREREESKKKLKKIDKEIAKSFEPVCFDVVKIYWEEDYNNVRGLSVKTIASKLSKYLDIKDYPGIPKGDYNVSQEDIKRTLDNLTEKGKIYRSKNFGTYSMEKIFLDLMAQKRDKIKF